VVSKPGSISVSDIDLRWSKAASGSIWSIFGMTLPLTGLILCRKPIGYFTRRNMPSWTMRAGFEYFKAFEQDAKAFEEFSKTPLTMAMLVLSGEKAGWRVPD
jgi:hypothetical protein